MQRALEQVRETLSWFVDQREHLTLVLDITDHEVAYVLKILERVDGEHTGDVFLNFAFPAGDAESYVRQIVESVQTQLAGVNSIRAEEGLPPWPELPPGCHDPRIHPSDRLRVLIAYVRERLPDHEDHRVVVSLLPVRIDDPVGYATAVRSLLPWQGLEPWMARVRVVLRDDRARPFVAPQLAPSKLEGVLFYDGLDLSPAAMTRALAEEAADREVPEPQRMQALLQLAALDFSHGRFEVALRKYGLLFGYYHRTAVPHMQALCLLGVGDVLRRAGRLGDAKVKYKQGLGYEQTFAMLPVTLNLVAAVGDVCAERREWQEAEGYYGIGDQIASKLLQVTTKCDLLEKQGVAFEALGRVGEACAKWHATADLASEVGYWERAESALLRLHDLYKRASMRAERAQVEDRLLVVRHRMRERGSQQEARA